MRSRKLPGLPVLTLDDAVHIGRVRRALVDAQRRRVAALIVATGRAFAKSLLPIEGVHAFGSHAITVHSREALRPFKSPGDLEPLLQRRRIPLLGTAVVTRGGDWVGTVRDYAIGPEGKISAVWVRDNLWKGLSGREKPIDREMIVAMGQDAVIVAEEVFDTLESEPSAPTATAD